MLFDQDPSRLSDDCTRIRLPVLAKAAAGPRRPSGEAGLRPRCATMLSARYVEHDSESTRGVKR